MTKRLQKWFTVTDFVTFLSEPKVVLIIEKQVFISIM